MQEFPDSQWERFDQRCFHSDDAVTAADGVAAKKSEGEKQMKGNREEDKRNDAGGKNPHDDKSGLTF